MQLTRFTDFALRALTFLCACPDRRVTIAEISGAYGISHHHLSKVMRQLRAGGLVHLHPGRGGGVTLANAPADIRLGDVVRATEPDFYLAMCFETGGSSGQCPILPACRLKGVLEEALLAFLQVLDRHTLADLVAGPAHRERLASLLGAGSTPNDAT